MRELPHTTIAIVLDHGRYYVTVTIGDREHDLARYPSAAEAAAAAAKWVLDRGLAFAPHAVEQLNEAQRLGRVVVVLDVVRGVM